MNITRAFQLLGTRDPGAVETIDAALRRYATDEDAVNAAWTTILERREDDPGALVFSTEGAAFTYLNLVVRSRQIDAIRRARSWLVVSSDAVSARMERPEMAEVVPIDVAPPEHTLADLEDVQDFLRRLLGTPAHRQLLDLLVEARRQDVELQALAAGLGVSGDALMQRACRLRKRLRAQLSSLPQGTHRKRVEAALRLVDALDFRHAV